VMVLGKKIGKVGAIDVDYERTTKPVQMTLLLREAIPLRDGYRIEVRDAGVLGGKQIYIDPGPRTGAVTALDDNLQGLVEPGAFEQIGNIAKGEGEVGQNLSDALANIRDFFGKMNDPKGSGSIARLVNDGELYGRLNDASDQLNKILTAIADGQGAIGQLVVNRETGEQARVFLANLRTISDRLLSTEGTLGLLLNDRETALDLQSVVNNIETMIADAQRGRGIIGQVLRNDDLAQQFAGFVANLDVLSQRLIDPNAGTLGRLTSEPVMANDLQATIANLREVTGALTRNDGLLGVLINDRDVGVRFRRILTQVSRAIEDAREAAPIANFVQVLLGTF
jgi:phospholipid/cholesterol/gamma-HCH transport system substrate-binding protein